MNLRGQMRRMLSTLAIIIFICITVRADDGVEKTISDVEYTEEHPLDGWVLGGGFCIVANGFDNYDDALKGPAAYLSRLNPGGIGIEICISYIMPAGFYHYKGLSDSLKLTYGFPVTPVTLFMLKGGAIGCAGGDSDGSGGGGFGLSPGIALMHRLSGSLAIDVTIARRFWIASGDFDLETLGARFGLSLIL